MGRYTTKEDDVDRISTSVYVTNFPDNVSAKELFLACKQYGHVVDSYIPVKKSKYGKRFGFVKFINVFSEERLVNNLCTVWIGRVRLHANIARFQRPNGKNIGEGNKKPNVTPTPSVKPNLSGSLGNEKSYRGVLNGDTKTKLVGKISEPSIVLGDECVMSMNVDNALFWKGQWVMLGIKSLESMENSKNVLGAGNSIREDLKALTRLGDSKWEGVIANLEELIGTKGGSATKMSKLDRFLVSESVISGSIPTLKLLHWRDSCSASLGLGINGENGFNVVFILRKGLHFQWLSKTDGVSFGEWSESNITSLIHVLDCFHKVSGLKINMCKSKIMGIEVDNGKVSRAATKFGLNSFNGHESSGKKASWVQMEDGSCSMLIGGLGLYTEPTMGKIDEIWGKE
ncbi:nucleotide-binding alpha-beta plait domain-containing protein [Tanacetum coccineum]